MSAASACASEGQSCGWNNDQTQDCCDDMECTPFVGGSNMQCVKKQSTCVAEGIVEALVSRRSSAAVATVSTLQTATPWSAGMCNLSFVKLLVSPACAVLAVHCLFLAWSVVSAWEGGRDLYFGAGTDSCDGPTCKQKPCCNTLADAALASRRHSRGEPEALI